MRRRLRGARRARLLPGELSWTPTARTASRARRATSRHQASRASRSPPARSATGCRSACGMALAGEAARPRVARLRAAQRRRMRRGLELGGVPVRRPPPARQPRRDHRLQQDPEPRRRSPRCWTSSRSPTSGAPSAGPSARSTATTTRRCTPRCSTAPLRRRAGPPVLIAHTVKGKGVGFMENTAGLALPVSPRRRAAGAGARRAGRVSGHEERLHRRRCVELAAARPADLRWWSATSAIRWSNRFADALPATASSTPASPSRT